MKTTKKILRIGDSAGIVLDKPLLQNLNLKIGELVEIDMKKIEAKK